MPKLLSYGLIIWKSIAFFQSYGAVNFGMTNVLKLNFEFSESMEHAILMYVPLELVEGNYSYNYSKPPL